MKVSEEMEAGLVLVGVQVKHYSQIIQLIFYSLKFTTAYFRKFVTKMGCIENLEYGISLDKLSIFDAGDVPTDLSLEESHEWLSLRVQDVLARKAIPFVVGGGNDQSFPNVCGLLEHLKQESGSEKVFVLCGRVQ